MQYAFIKISISLNKLITAFAWAYIEYKDFNMLSIVSRNNLTILDPGFTRPLVR